MRENNLPPEQPGPANPPLPSGADTAAAASAISSAGAFHPGAAAAAHGMPPPIGAVTDMGHGRWRQRILWLFIGVAVLLIGATVVMVVRMLQADHALRNVARVAVVPPLVPDVAPPSRLPAPVTATAAAGMGTPATGAAPLAQDAQAPGAQASLPVQKAAGSVTPAASRDAGGEVAKTADEVRSETGAAAPKASDAGQKARAEKKSAAKAAARTARRQDALRRDPTATRTAQRDTTFRRCPPLGKKGAVMCRWHICNGAAGKERVCRPYLERRP